MKILKLNVWNFNLAHEIIDFIRDVKPDPINMQEVSTGKYNGGEDKKTNFYELIKNTFNYEGIFALKLTINYPDNEKAYYGNGFLTNLDIIDCGFIFDRNLQSHMEVDSTHPYLTDKSDFRGWNFYYNFSSTQVWATLKYDGKYFRNLTTHFTVSKECTETLQITQQSDSICEFIKNNRDMPTIFSGDLNIHEQSYSINNIESVLEMVTKSQQNSLNPKIHPAFKNNLPNGMKVDYIFQKGFKTIDVDHPLVSISDHLPVIAKLELM